MSIDVTEGFQKKNNFRLYEKDVSIPILRSAIENVWITIAIPTYKRGKLLKKTIDSALLQSDKYLFDIIIVDNDSQRNSETERLGWEHKIRLEK